MGRPKLSDLSCPTCNMKFKKKTHLEEHIVNECSSKQLKKKFCNLCKRNIDYEKFKLHMHTEHKLQFANMEENDPEDLSSYENGYVLLKKKKVPKRTGVPKMSENSKNEPVIISNIKIEPVNEDSGDMEHQEDNKEFIQKELESSLNKQHKKHKRIKKNTSKSSLHNSFEGSSATENGNSIFSGQPTVVVNNAGVPLLSNNGTLNFGQNTQPPYYIINGPGFQNQANNLGTAGNNSNFILGNNLNFGANNSFVASATQPDAQSSQFVRIPNIPSFDDVPKFDWKSKEYEEFIEGFVLICQGRTIPLNLELALKVGHVSFELSQGLGAPSAGKNKKHLFFLGLYKILSDIQLKQLQHVFLGK